MSTIEIDIDFAIGGDTVPISSVPDATVEGLEAAL
jgi:hypothetical protein